MSDLSPSSRSSADFVGVCDKELSIKDFHPVYDEVRQLSAHWEQIAISLRLRIDTINSIEANFSGKDLSCLRKVLEYWLKKDYDYEHYGIPCWRRVCVAVKEGGGDPALAEDIASEHPLPVTTGGATPHPLPATTGGATPHPLPATTGGATPHPLPATTGGATTHPLPATTGGATSHSLPATTGGATPHPLPVTTGGATPHSLPATTGGAPLPATTGGATPHSLPATTGGATPHPLPATTAGGATPHPQPTSTTGGAPNPLPSTTGGATLSLSSKGKFDYSSSGKDLTKNQQHLLQDEFEMMIQLTEKSFKSDDLPDIVNYLTIGPDKKTVKELREEFERISTIPELFAILQNKYSSCFDYTLMKKLVGVFLPENHLLKMMWTSYEEKLKDYFVNSSDSSGRD